MDITNSIKKLESSGESIGGIVGFLTENGVDQIVEDFNLIMQGKVHLPNMFGFQPTPKTTQGIMAALVGWILEEINLHPVLTRIGGFAKTAGGGYAVGSYLAHVLFYATHSSEGSDQPNWIAPRDRRDRSENRTTSNANPFKGVYA